MVFCGIFRMAYDRLSRETRVNRSLLLFGSLVSIGFSTNLISVTGSGFEAIKIENPELTYRLLVQTLTVYYAVMFYVLQRTDTLNDASVSPISKFNDAMRDMYDELMGRKPHFLGEFATPPNDVLETGRNGSLKEFIEELKLSKLASGGTIDGAKSAEVLQKLEDFSSLMSGINAMLPSENDADKSFKIDKSVRARQWLEVGLPLTVFGLALFLEVSRLLGFQL